MGQTPAATLVNFNSNNNNNNTKNLSFGGMDTGPGGGAGPAVASSSSRSKWPKRPTAVTAATATVTSRSSRITKMMNRLRPPGRRTKTVLEEETVDDSSCSFLDEDTTTCGGNENEFVSTATVTFALSTVYCVDDDGGAG
uniref:(northern house mosquito) hypothetical protein n=1 Tax=Culex pipiens TaxID=7175 RepID=A0A8D8CKS2_CULPI